MTRVLAAILLLLICACRTSPPHMEPLVAPAAPEVERASPAPDGGAVTTTSLRTVENTAIHALESISGYQYGGDLGAWRRWLKRVEKEPSGPGR